MKNKEIEELLNILKKCAREEKATLKLNEIACKTILSYIEQLEKENKKYKDLGFEHLCKKNEQLENNRDKAIEYINKNIAIYHKQLPLIAIDYEEVINILKGDSDD